MITSVSEDFYNTLSPLPELKALDDFKLNVQGAGGHDLPYMGYIEVSIQVSFLANTDIEVPVLVMPTTNYGLQVPVVLGTNVIRLCRNMCQQDTEIPKEWNDAFVSVQQGRIGIVKSTNKVPLKLQPNETVTLSGLIRKEKEIDEAVTEPTEDASSRIGVCPRVVKIEKIGTYQRVPVRIYNISAKVLEIAPQSSLCELQEVKVLRHLEPNTQKEQTVHASQQTAKEGKQHKLLDEVMIGENNLSEAQKNQVKQFLEKWNDIFSEGLTDLGNCDLVKHKINLHDNEPFKEPHRRIPPGLFQEVREHLSEMLQAGAIRPSQSPYSSNVVIVRKKDGSIRFCVDFRKLNSKTIKDAYAIPRVEDSLHLLAGAKYFTKLDLRSGYWQVEIDERDKAKTAFQVGTLGFFEFHRMPFGLCNAPATFQRLMERCMGDMNLRDCLIYLDDVIIFSATFEEHLNRLEAVFSRLKEHNLKLKASKCECLQSKVTYLGHIVSEAGIQTDPEKTEAIKNWPRPNSVKDVRSFLGFTGYYRRFIKNYARIARPLNDLLVGQETNPKDQKSKKAKVKKIPFEWNESQQKAFDLLREKLTNPPILAYADYHLPFKLHTDASTTGLGAVLYQHQDGLDRVIAYASRSLKPSEKNYPAHKLEFLALKWSVTEKFHDYLYGTNFEVMTDNNPLTYVFTTAKLDATGHRWLAELSNYTFTIQYRSGKKNADADGLSRQHEEKITTVFPDIVKSICQTVIVEKEDAPFAESLIAPNALVTTQQTPEENIPEQVLASALKSTDWKKAQAADRNIKFIIDCILKNHQPTNNQARSHGVDIAFLQDWNSYTLKNDVLYKRSTANDETYDQLVLPSSLKDIVFKAYHDDLGHQGRDRTISLLRQRFFWPGMNRFVKEKVKACDRCIRRKTPPVKAAPLVNISSSAPMELVCIDYLSLERSKGGFENILVITDHFSRYAQAIPTRNQTAQTTARVLFENFFLHYGFPAKLHSDKAANFESKVIKKLCEIAGVLKTHTTPYHAMGNGMVERFNKTLLNMFGTLSEKQKSDWKAHVSTLTHAYNAAVHESTGFSPFFLMFGRHPRLAIDAVLGIGSSEERKSHQDYVDKLKDRLAYAYKKAGEEAKIKGQKYKHHYDQNVRASVLEPGDRVLVRKVGIKGKHKLADIWESETYLVLRKPMPDVPVYIVQKESSNAKPRTLHRNMLLPFNGLPCFNVADEEATPSRKNVRAKPEPEESIHQTDSSDSSTEGEYEMENTVYNDSPKPEPKRKQRLRKRPNWMNSAEWQIGMEPFIITVDPKDVVFI